MENKHIHIIGTSNRYQLKKIIQGKPEIKLKQNSIVDTETITRFYTSDLQKKILLESLSYPKEYLLVIKELKKKITSYKQQDLTKDVYNSQSFIHLEYVLQLLKESNLKCYFCSQELLLLYSIIRESTQWTLDRIDNDIGHNIDNVLITCLECNLKRRKTNKDAFMFTKNLTIVKDDCY